MTEYEFANTRLGEYKRRGAELIPVFCPFCGGGGSRDRYTFALNTENHTFNCKRGSCGRSGHFTELCRAFGETANKEGGRYINTAYVRKSYILPSGAINKPTDRVTAYLNARKITEATMKAFGIGTAADGRISFPCYRSAEDCRERRPTFIKYREPRKLQPGEPKMTAEPGAEPILFGLHLCNPERGLLYITEGEIDCMSVWQAAEGMINVVSVPTGSTGFTWVESCADELKLYENLAFFGDADAPGKKMLSDIIAKFDDKVVHVPDFDAYNGAKDANEILYRYGTQGIAGVLAAIKPQPVTGLLDLAEVRAVDLSEIGRVRTGIIELDQATGGMLDGDLSVWTGKRGEGKSSFLNQLAVEAVEQNVNVCIYSGEVPADRMKYQINLCAAGRENVLEKTDGMTGRMIYYLDRKKLTALDGWYGRKIWLYDNDIAGTDEYNNVFLKFTRAFKQYDCRLFIVDNLMTVSGG
ncbi:MAG: toprim domain-containing protein, partial [Eubacteriales bacterium]|nr:toprim domain-containing protein [Eubacteriales bacterium]